MAGQPTDRSTERLARFIEERRLSLGLTKSAAARRAGVSRSSWHEIEAGERPNIQPETLHQFERALELERGRLRRLLTQTDDETSRLDLAAPTSETDDNETAVRRQLAEYLFMLDLARMKAVLDFIRNEGPDLTSIHVRLNRIEDSLDELKTHVKRDEPHGSPRVRDVQGNPPGSAGAVRSA